MADIRFTIQADDEASKKLERLKYQINALEDAIKNLNRSNLGGSPAFADALIGQLNRAKSELQSLQGTFVQTFANIEGFSTRAVAAMKGIPDAVAPATRALDETDKIMRAGANGGKLLEQSLKSAIAAATGLGAAITPTADRARDLAAAFGAQVTEAGFAAKALKETENSYTSYVSILRHGTAIIDGALRGQRGQMEASTIALVRDSGLLQAALANMGIGFAVWAGAGVAAAAAIGYALEQLYQRFASIRDTQTSLAVTGFGTAPNIPNIGAFSASKEFDTLRDATKESAGTIREWTAEANKLPPAAQGIRTELVQMAVAYAALKGLDPQKVIEELVKAAQHSAGAFAEAMAKIRGMEGALDSTGHSTVELVKHTADLVEAYRIAMASGVDKSLDKVGTATRLARNEIFQYGGQILDIAVNGPIAFDGNAAALFRLGQAVRQVLNPMEGVTAEARNLTGAMIAENAAITQGNAELDKRTALYRAMLNAQAAMHRLSADPKATPEARQRAIYGAEVLEGQVRQAPANPMEEFRHKIALEHIHAEAQARKADIQAQLEAARAVAVETQRHETQRFVAGGMDPETAARYAAESEATQKANNAALEAERNVQDQDTAIALAGIQARIAAEAHGSKEKVALQNEYIKVLEEAAGRGRRTQLEVDQARKVGVTYAREANHEEYAEAAKNYENQLREARGSYDQITKIIEEWKEKATKAFKEGSVEQIRALEDVARAGILSYRPVVETAVSAANDIKQANRDVVAGFAQQQQARLRDMGYAGIGAAPAAIEAERAEAIKRSKENVEAFNQAMKDADRTQADLKAKEKIYWDLWREGVEIARKNFELDNQMAEAQKRISEAAKDTQIAQLKLAEAIAKSRGDLEEIVRLRIQEAQIIAGDKYATPAQKINAQADIVGALTDEQNRRFSEMDRFTSAQERLDRIRIQAEKYRLQAQVSSHDMSKETMAEKESEFSSKVMAEQEKRIENELKIDSLTDAQKEKLYNHLAELYEKDAELQIAAQARVSEAIEKENEKRAKLLKGAFDEIGSGLEKSLTGLLTGEKGVTNIQDLRKSITGALVKETFSLGSQYLGSKLAPMLGVKTEGLADTGLGTVLSRAFANMLGLSKDTPKTAMEGAAEKIKKAADAQENAVKLIKPAADGLKEASDKLKEAADALKGGKSPSSTMPGGGGGGGGGGSEGSVPANIPMEMKAVTAQGHTIQMNALIADKAQAVLDDLTAQGYKINRLSGYRPGATTYRGTRSLHSAGLAMDINPDENPMAGPGEHLMTTNLPDNFGETVASRGGTWGGGFRRPDPMHVSFQPNVEKASSSVNDLANSANKASTELGKVQAPGTSSGAKPPVSGDAPAYALGGPVGSDTVLARLTPGERVLTLKQRALYDSMFPYGIESHADGGIAGSHPGLTSLAAESKGFAPFHLVQTNPGLGKGWGLILGLLGAVGLAAGAALLFGDDKDKKEKELAEKLLKAKDTDTDSKQTTRQLTEEELAKTLPRMHSGGLAQNEMAVVLARGERVLPAFAEGGIVTGSDPESPTYSPGAGGSTPYAKAVKDLSQNVSTISDKFVTFEEVTTKTFGAIAQLGRGAAQAESPMKKLTDGFSTIGSAFSGLKSIFNMFSGDKGSSGGSGGGDALGGIGSIFGALGSVAKLFMLFDKGGIVPSAEGGMVVGGGSALARGGTLSVLHPNEMVLPRHISQSVQDMAEGGVQGSNAPDVHFHLHTIDQRSGAQFLMGHRDTIAGLYRQSFRSFNPNVPMQ